MKSQKVFVQRLNQELKRLYPARKIEARKRGSVINIFIIKKKKGWVFTRERKICMGYIDMFCFYQTKLNTKIKKLKLAIDDLAYEYFGEDINWMDDDEFLAAHKRANKTTVPKPKKKIVITEEPDFNIKGAL